MRNPNLTNEVENPLDKSIEFKPETYEIKIKNKEGELLHTFVYDPESMTADRVLEGSMLAQLYEDQLKFRPRMPNEIEQVIERKYMKLFFGCIFAKKLEDGSLENWSAMEEKNTFVKNFNKIKGIESLRALEAARINFYNMQGIISRKFLEQLEVTNKQLKDLNETQFESVVKVMLQNQNTSESEKNITKAPSRTSSRKH